MKARDDSSWLWGVSALMNVGDAVLVHHVSPWTLELVFWSCEPALDTHVRVAKTFANYRGL